MMSEKRRNTNITGQAVCAAAAAACLVYGAVIRSLHTGTGFFMFWIAAGIGFLVLAACIRLRVFRQLPRPLKTACIALAVLAGVLFVGIEGCILAGFHARGEENLDYIVVLGAQVRKNGPSKVLRYRLDTAYDYLMQNPDTVCIVSGGQGRNEPCPEAEGMYTYLVDQGIPEGRIIREASSENTAENLGNTKELIDAETARVGVVTNNFHVFRSRMLARHLGYKNVCSIAAPSVPAYLPNNMVREFLGVVKDFLCGNI